MGARWTRAPIKSPPPGRRGLSSAPQPDRRIKLRTLMVGAYMGQVEAEYCSSLFSLRIQAVKASFLVVPAATRRVYTARRTGLQRLPTRAPKYRAARTVARPPQIVRL